MKFLKKYAKHLFIDGFSGMASGLFATLIVGTILAQIGSLVSDIGGIWVTVGTWFTLMASVAKTAMGAGIGIGVARKYKASPLVTASGAVAGLIGAFASQLLSADGAATITFGTPGEPLGAFVAAYVAIELGKLVSEKTKIDILVTPLTCILSGGTVGLLIGPSVSACMRYLGDLINAGANAQPFLMGIAVATLMGLALTLPISSAALGIMLGLSDIAAGAAAVGCAAQMVGFAVSSFRENKMGGLIAQGIGTSMLQVPNIFRHPLIWVPPTLASAILGPISTCVFGLVNNPSGSGMGTSGLVGPIMGFQEMTAAGTSAVVALLEILLMYFVAPAALSLFFSESMRKLGWIKKDDMKLEL